MKSSDVYVDHDDLSVSGGSVGIVGSVKCPKCGWLVSTSERPYQDAKCECGIKWRIVLYGEGVEP